MTIDFTKIQCSKLLLLFIISLVLVMSGCQKKAEEDSASLSNSQTAQVKIEYVGRNECIECHKRQYDLFVGSDHDLAMDIASAETVLGDFDDVTFDHLGVVSRFFTNENRYFVNTEGPDGEFKDFEVKYVFGARPLQQYLIEFPGGRYQCLPLCWDTRPQEQGGQKWFHIYGNERIAPNDILYWTRITQNWNYMCSECHSTNLKKKFDRFKKEYNTSWSEIDVSCEACHGPGSEHVKWAIASEQGQNYPTQGYLGLSLRLKEVDGATWVFKDTEKGTAERSVPRRSRTLVEMCARCHARRTVIDEDYIHNRSFLDTHMPSVLEEQLYYPDGQILEEVYVYASFLQSKMYAAGVSCQDCHEPHSGKVYVQGNALCYRCHLVEKYGVYQHHFHKDNSTGTLCVECHMAERTYMVVDPRRDHSLRVPRPDLSDRLETPNYCIKCHDHADKSNQWAAEYNRKWYGELEQGKTHYGEIFYAGRRGYPEAREELIRLAADSQNPPMIRATAFYLLGGYPAPDTVNAIQKAVYDADPLIRTTGLQSLAFLPIEERYPILKHLLQDPVRLVRIRAAFSLAETRPEQMTDQENQLLNYAIQDYKQTQYINADHPTAHLNLGVLATMLGDTNTAEKEYRKALEIEPLLTYTYINLADLFRQQGRDAEGKQILENALEFNPEVADIHHALGLLYAREKDIPKSLEHLKRSQDLDPENARYGYVYGIALNSTGKTKEALEVLSGAMEIHPYDRDLLYALATLNRDLGNFQEALTYASRLVEIFPEAPAFRQLVQMLRQQIQTP